MRNRPTSSRDRIAVEPAADSSTSLVPVDSRRTIAIGDAKTIVVQPRIPMPYKAMIWFSFGLNALLLLFMLIGGLSAWRFYNRTQAQMQSVRDALAMDTPAGQRLEAYQTNPAGAVDTARYTIDELLGSIQGLQNAHIKTSVAIDRQLPISLQVPVNQETSVRTTAPVPLVAPARFTLPGGGGQINGSVALSLPAGMELPINLNMTIPISSSVPVQFDVPVDIAMQDTELADDFGRLQRLLQPAAELVRAR
jgi:hypothetical protein